MSTSVLLIIAINLFTLQRCLSMQDNFNNEVEPNLKSQLLDINCKSEQECEQFLGGKIKHVHCVEKMCVCKEEHNKTTACLPKVSTFKMIFYLLYVFFSEKIMKKRNILLNKNY